VETPTAAVVVVGNEVLSAKVRDENGPYAARRLRDRGVRLVAILTLPDEIDVVAEAVSRERARADWLVTSGGVGPTHDDVTLPAVARALGRGLARHPALAANVRRWHLRHGAEPPEAALRMADVPEGTRLLGDPSFPVMVVENVVILPGPPQFFRLHLDAFVETLQAAPYRLAALYLDLGEDHFADALQGVAREHPEVDIGSYPRFDGADHRVKVTFEGKDAARVEAAVAAFTATLPRGALLRREGP
jgi:molybdenum cofactor synthesis domain-containing protein